MASPARRASWLSYDAKRKRTARRLMKERARDAVRRARYQKRNRCEYCGRCGATVWHHLDYRCPLFVDEVCLECHRRLHPRKVNGGKVR